MILLFVIATLVVGFASGAEAGVENNPVVHDIRMTLDPDNGRFQATDRISVNGTPELRFTLADTLNINAVRVGDRDVTPARDHGYWSVDTNSSGLSTILIHYSGTAREQNADGRGAMMLQNGAVFLPESAGWVPNIIGSPQHYRLQLDVRDPYRVLATGRLTHESRTKDRYQASFIVDYPSEPPSVFAGIFEVNERIIGDTRLRTYFPETLNGLADAYLQSTSEYLREYSESIGAYPYSIFSVVASPDPVGLSFPGLTYVSRRILPLPYMRGRSLAHEILHSWWGNGVYVDYAQGNWSEGLTTYLADYAVTAKDSDKAQEMRLSWLRDYAALPDTRDHAARTFTAKSHDAGQVIGYNKVAFFFHMLRGELGDDVFNSALRRFWRKYRFQRAGWDDLMASFAELTNRDLHGFFSQWLDRPGAPQLSLRSAHSTLAANGYETRVELTQEPPVYEFAVPIRLDTDDGPQWHSIRLEGENAEIRITTNSRPVGVAIDPEYQVFRRLDVAETPPILRDVTLSDQAACVLAGDSEEIMRIARSLALRLLDVEGHCATGVSDDAVRSPLLVVGTRPEVEQVLSRLGLDPLPQDLSGQGDAVVWTQRTRNLNVAMVVAARDAEALLALGGPLPHYGRKSYLVFDNGRALRSGIWSVRKSPLYRKL
ncbi:MAG: M1 family aminopeptidase [Gammaproteobacteria bacterium]|nr:M1 family aminopeptidase [Gammaproteobacteria bacterium]